jgi:hypothetical protein
LGKVGGRAGLLLAALASAAPLPLLLRAAGPQVLRAGAAPPAVRSAAALCCAVYGGPPGGNQIPCSRGLLTFLCSHADPPSSSNPTAPPRWLVRCSRGRRWLGSPSPGSARSLVWDHRTSSPHLLAPTGPGVLFFTAKLRFWRHAPGVLARGPACAAAYVEDAPLAPVIGLVGSLIKHM